MDDTRQQVAKMLGMTVLVVTYFQALTSAVTVQEGRAAILTCPGYVPNPRRDISSAFRWYKASLSTIPGQSNVAYHYRSGQTSLGDLSGRATIDGATGALEIPQSRVSDDHVYACFFQSNASGNILNETELVVTVTPSESDLKVTASPPGLVKQGTLVTFKCSASRVKPPPKEMYLKFVDDDKRLLGQYKNERNSDNLTSSVSVEYAMMANRGHNGRKLKCHYITAAGNTVISSQEATVNFESVTVEEGRAAILKCPGYVPNREGDRSALFTWYKASQLNRSDQSRVALYDKSDWAQNLAGDLSGRATIDRTTGALVIPQTRVSDDHVYTCYFQNTTSGTIQNETQLVITVTPSESDLKVTASPPGLVTEGTSVTFKCSASRVKPLPKEMYFKIVGDENQLPGQYKNATNNDNLTHTVSVAYTMVLYPCNDAQQLKCYYISATGNTVTSSDEVTVKVLRESILQSVVLGTLLAFSLIGNLVTAMYFCIRRKPNNVLSHTQALRENQCNERGAYDGYEQSSPRNHANITKNRNDAELYENDSCAVPPAIYEEPDNAVFTQPQSKNDAKISKNRKDAKLYGNNPAAAPPPPVYKEPNFKEIPTYLELH